MHILDINATSVGAVMKPAGLEASKGVISVNYGKDPLDPTWKDDAGMKKYFEFMAKYYPDGDKDSSFNSYGYSTSQLMIHVLEAVRRQSDPRERHEAGDQPRRTFVLDLVAAGHRRQHHAGRLSRQQAVADDASSTASAGNCSARSSRTQVRRASTRPIETISGTKRSAAPGAADFCRWAKAPMRRAPILDETSIPRWWHSGP